jgi:hypothetical protein
MHDGHGDDDLDAADRMQKPDRRGLAVRGFGDGRMRWGRRKHPACCDRKRFRRRYDGQPERVPPLPPPRRGDALRRDEPRHPDLRVITLEVPQQEVITSDNVTVKVNAVIFFQVTDPQAAIIRVFNFLDATSQIAQTTLRAVLG